MCKVHREFIEAQLRHRRNATAIYQDLVDSHGYTGAYNCVKRFAAQLRQKEPEQFDRLSFLPGEKMQVDYGEGALTLVPGGDRYKKPRLFVATLRHSRRSFRRVVWKSSQQVWAHLHEQAFRYCAFHRWRTPIPRSARILGQCLGHLAGRFAHPSGGRS